MAVAAEATCLLIQPADDANEDEQHGSTISIAGETLSTETVNRSQVLRNLIVGSDGSDHATTTLPIDPSSFTQWMLFDCNDCMPPETVCKIIQVRTSCIV